MLTFFLILFLRHLFFDRGWKKSTPTEVPSLCIGNVAVGGTGKTPMTELVIRTLREDEVSDTEALEAGFTGSLFDVPPRNIAVLSRGYRRKSRGFFVVTEDGTAETCGDEPLQIKRKFPDVTVVVDEDRVEGAAVLAQPARLPDLPARRRPASCAPFPKADVIILDDAYQHRRIVSTRSIVLTTYNRPVFKDFLLPFGRLRDLPGRIDAADTIVVTKCPPYLMDSERRDWAEKLGLKDFDSATCIGVNRSGRRQRLLFATMVYEGLQPVFPEGDVRYLHSKLLVLFSGIADDTPLRNYLSDKYRIIEHENYPDHHFYTARDIAHLEALAVEVPPSIIVTTEKDAQRLRDCSLSLNLRQRLFYAPVNTVMLTAKEQTVFKNFLRELI